MTPEELARARYHPDRDMALDHTRCFLCGVSLDDASRSVEHVFGLDVKDGSMLLFDADTGARLDAVIASDTYTTGKTL